MKKLTEAFKGKSELDKNQEELNVVTATIAELNEKLSKYNVMLQGAQLEHELEEDASTKKRLKKLQTGIDKINTEIAEHQKRSDGLSQAITEELETQRLARIEEAKQTFEQQVFETHRINALKQAIERLLPVYYSKSGIVQPQGLKALAGLEYGDQFDPTNPAHEELIQATNEADKAGQERAQKEIDEMIKKLEAIVGLK